MKTAVLAILSLLVQPVATWAQEWGTYQGNPSHTGYVPVAVHPAAIRALWTRSFSGNLNPAAIGGGRVFVSESGYFTGGLGLHALDAGTGATVWSHPDFGAVFSINPPAYANGAVYVQVGKGTTTIPDPYLYAFEAANGTPRFRVPFAAQWERYLAPTPWLGDLFVNGGYYGGSYRFGGTDGAQRWFTGLPQYDGWTPAVDNAHVYAYVGDYAPGLYVLDRQTGTQLFKIADPRFSWNGWTMGTAPVLTHDGDVIASHDTRLLRFDVQGRRIQWEVTRAFRGQATVKGDVVYANDGGSLTAWDGLTGTLQWTWLAPAGAPLDGNIVATDTHVFVQTASTTYAVNLATRMAEWSYAAAGSIAIGDGLLAITDDLSVYVFSIVVDPTVPLPVTGLSVESIVGGQVTLRWAPPTMGAAPTGYVLEGGVLPGQTLASMSLPALPEQTIAAPPGVFFLRVRTVAGSATSAPSNEVRVFVNQAALPSAPDRVTAMGFGSTVRLMWKNTFDGGPVERNTLLVSGSLSGAIALGPAEAFAYDAMPPGTYTFSVRAENGFGSSPPSAGVSVSFPASCTGLPKAPENLLAYRTGNVLRLVWDPPASGPAPTSFVLHVSGAFSGSLPLTARSLSGAVGPGTYTFAVSSVNTCGASAATAPQTVIVP